MAPPPAAFQASLVPTGDTAPKRRSGNRQSRYRCSRCGALGHNVRGCTVEVAAWYAPRCSRCGEPGHNARSCPRARSAACRVCSGTARLRCSQCGGSGQLRAVAPRLPALEGRDAAAAPSAAPPPPPPLHERKTVWLSPEQKRMAEIARSRARFLVDGVKGEVAAEELVGGESVARVGRKGRLQLSGVLPELPVETRCARCLGRGFLSCMACSAE